MLTNNKAEMWGKEACTRKTVNVNILQTQFHSCFCVQAKHNSSWPSFTTTGRLRDCFLFERETSQSASFSVFCLQRLCKELQTGQKRLRARSAEAHVVPQQRLQPPLSLSISWHLEHILNGQGERGCGQAASTLRLNLKAFQTQITAELLVAFAVV